MKDIVKVASAIVFTLALGIFLIASLGLFFDAGANGLPTQHREFYIGFICNVGLLFTSVITFIKPRYQLYMLLFLVGTVLGYILDMMNYA